VHVAEQAPLTVAAVAGHRAASARRGGHLAQPNPTALRFGDVPPVRFLQCAELVSALGNRVLRTAGAVSEEKAGEFEAFRQQ
jgi:hypothetical protein